MVAILIPLYVMAACFAYQAYSWYLTNKAQPMMMGEITIEPKAAPSPTSTPHVYHFHQGRFEDL